MMSLSDDKKADIINITSVYFDDISNINIIILTIW